MRAALAKGEVRQCGTDSPIAIRLHYVGTGTITSVTTTTGTGIVMITSDGGTDSYDFATYSTVGLLVDKINSDGIFEAKVLDTVRSESTATQFVDGVITAATEDGVSYYDVKVDTDAADYFAIRLTNNRGFDKNKLTDNHRVHLQEIKYYMDFGTAAAGAVKVYKVKGTIETLVFSALSVDTTETTINFASGEGKLTAGEGEDIVIKLDDAGNLVDAATNYVRVTGILE